MKKILVLIGAVVLLLGSVAQARGFPHRQPPPVATSTPPVASSSLSFGFFQPPAGVPSPWTMEFTDGAFPAGSGNLVIFIEPPYNDAQILAGKFDSQLKSFATAALAHSGQVMLPLNEEVNCDNSDPWGATDGNITASIIAAFQHEENVLKATDPNLIFAYSVNNDSCYGEGGLTAYYPGSAYVSVIALDGFDGFGPSETWAQVFDSAITQLQTLGKPIWITSEGADTNQSQFLEDSFAGAETHNIPVELYFNQSVPGNAFQLTSVAVSTLKQLL